MAEPKRRVYHPMLRWSFPIDATRKFSIVIQLDASTCPTLGIVRQVDASILHLVVSCMVGCAWGSWVGGKEKGDGGPFLQRILRFREKIFEDL